MSDSSEKLEKILMHDERIRVLERSHEKTAQAIDAIRKSLESLVRLEERHAESKEAINRAFTYIEKIEARLEEIERKMPGLVEVRRWVVRGVLAIVSVVFVALLSTIII